MRAGDGADERACPLSCGPLSSGGPILRDNRYGLPGTSRIGWCRSCGLGVTLDAPDREELARLYESVYVEEGMAGRAPRTGGLARVWHRLNGSLPLTDRDLRPPVLDIGSHTGEALRALRERGLEAVGLEPNPKAAAIARAAGLEVIEQDVEAAELPRDHFGSVLLSQVLEHVEDPAGVLRIARDTVRPDGIIYVIVPNARSVWRSVFGSDWVHWHVPFHLYHHTERSLARLCSLNGLRISRIANVTPGEWLLMSLEARRNARRGVYRLESFSGRYGRRALLAPLGRLFDALHRGDAIVAEVVRD